MPWAQLLVVYLIQFSEPITATVIYPFINQFVRETGITGGDERKTGYYAGMIVRLVSPFLISLVDSNLFQESTFFLAEAVTVVFWGMASDRFGRRPVLLFGPLGLSLVMVAFGMTTAFPWLVVFRFLQGVFNGNIGISYGLIRRLLFDMITTGVSKAVIGEASVVPTCDSLKLISLVVNGLHQHGRCFRPNTSYVVYGNNAWVNYIYPNAATQFLIFYAALSSVDFYHGLGSGGRTP